MKIENAEKKDHQKLIAIWEDSVRATHHFLKEDDLLALKPLILNQYFDAVDLLVARNESGTIVGFCGMHDDCLEMLFVSPAHCGNGVGKLLANHVIRQGVTRVDVNEQNQQALGFYQKMGFTVVGRSPLDGQGKPYPLLHMNLNARE